MFSDTLTHILICSVSILFLGCNHKQDITANEVVSNSIITMGGMENILNTKSKTITGVYFEPAYNLVLKFKLQYQRPNSRLMEGKMDDGTFFYEGFDGETAWEYYKGDTMPRIMNGEAYKAIERGAEFDVSFVNYENKNNSIALIGIRKIGNRQTYELDLIESGGWVKTYFIDTSTFLVVAVKKEMPVHAKGPDISILVNYAEYNEVNGVLYPFTITERDISDGGKILNAFFVNQIEVNTLLDPKIFDHLSATDN